MFIKHHHHSKTSIHHSNYPTIKSKVFNLIGEYFYESKGLSIETQPTKVGTDHALSHMVVELYSESRVLSDMSQRVDVMVMAPWIEPISDGL